MARKRKSAEAGGGSGHDPHNRLELQMAAVCAIARLAEAAEGLPEGSEAKAWALDRVEMLLDALEESL